MAKPPAQHPNAGINEFGKEPTVLTLMLLGVAVLGTFFTFIYYVSP